MTIPFTNTSFPEVYEQSLVGPLFRPWAEVMLDEVGLQSTDRVLDVACGTGVVARLAKERLGESGTVVGGDMSAPVLAVARRVAPSIDWRQGDAATLPLRGNEQFDVVICQQGLQFFSDRAAAAREMRRALAGGGRLAVSTWISDEDLPVLRELRRVAERHLGPVLDRRHGFADAGALQALLREAGLHDIQMKTLARSTRFKDGMDYVRLNAIALLGMSAVSKDMGEEDRTRTLAAIVRDSADVVSASTDEAGFSFELRSNIAIAKA